MIAVDLSAALIASLGWYTGSSSRAGTTFGIVNVWQPKKPAQEDVCSRLFAGEWGSEHQACSGPSGLLGGRD